MVLKLAVAVLTQPASSDKKSGLCR